MAARPPPRPRPIAPDGDSARIEADFVTVPDLLGGALRRLSGTTGVAGGWCRPMVATGPATRGRSRHH
ncbi:MAG: hypothetical protein AVDCRST_MAG59-1856 [uncultured Thermomicrobiales bacterium]|uniref:Uncharacterized protein n=1 Tax=uncultured Thermomicrobiales bacterium TaxID=1645740 RepID=A0A6J4UJ52_9BACT|nr:MAG: hypothetical protein AVDCRST_MAG59-1856 [uncultured Thermomicrobiales bacterium]